MVLEKYMFYRISTKDYLDLYIKARKVFSDEIISGDVFITGNAGFVDVRVSPEIHQKFERFILNI